MLEFEVFNRLKQYDMERKVSNFELNMYAWVVVYILPDCLPTSFVYIECINDKLVICMIHIGAFFATSKRYK